jgi:hypothetical protein
VGIVTEWARRVGLAYFVVANAGLPFELMGPLGGAYSVARQWLVRTATRLVTGLDVSLTVTGSGDTLFHYCELAVTVGLALVAGTAWHLWRRGAPVSPRTIDLVTVLVRYALAAAMLSYGWFKIIPVQMPAPGPERLLNTLGDTSPMGLLWALMGASPGYQMFAGFGEALGGVLLLWRRTTLLGALILAGVLANVVALNLAYDVPVKLYSTQLLVMALFLIAPHARRLIDLLILNRTAPPAVLRPFPLTRGWARWTALAVKTLLVLVLIVMPIASSWQAARQYGLWAPRHPLQGIYAVTAFTRGGVSGGAVDDAHRWVRVGIGLGGRLVSIQRADGTTRPLRTTIDEAKRTLAFRVANGPPMVLQYTVDGEGALRVEGTFDGGRIEARLQRRPEDATVLTGRGFHWISEAPYNR